ncbi:TasA family protein [Baekduia sp. Peel2402]|uniref:TasA family protein n=1 Tax=Baekduia sp. Peel2402 TaxID=3458296 RepID=UPI00403E4131
MSRILSLKVLASIASLSVFGAVGAWGTYSAFTDTTGTTGSTFSSGTVRVTDDDAGSALFGLTGLIPGVSATKCINVTNAGDVAFSNVALSATATGTLGGALQVVIDKGTGATGGASNSCTNFVQGTAGLITGLLNALPTVGSPQNDGSAWNPGDTRSYRVKVTLDPLAANSFQGKTAGLDLTWTASS